MEPASYDYITIPYCLVFTVCMVLAEVLLEHVFVYNKSLKAEKVKFSSSLFADCVTLCQFFWCAVISIIRLNFRVKFSRNLKLLMYYLLLTALIFGATGMATMSLNYVSYPTKVVFKSAKLVPAMLINTLIMGKSYSLKEYLTAVCLCIGAALYSYNGNKLTNSSPLLVTHQIQGVMMLLVSVTSDAFAPNLTQYLMSGKLTTEDTVTVEDIILNTNVMGFVLLGGYMLYQGEISEAIDLPEFDRMSFITVSTIGLFTAVAVSFYTHIIKRSGSVIAVAIGTLRKIITIVLSYVVFPKEVLTQHYIGSIAVIVGILLESIK